MRLRVLLHSLYKFSKNTTLSIYLYGFTAESYLNSIFPFFSVPNRWIDERRLFLTEWLISSDFLKLKSSLELIFDGENKNHREQIIKSFISFVNLRRLDKDWQSRLDRINVGVCASHNTSNFTEMYRQSLQIALEKKFKKGSYVYMVSFGSADGIHEERVHKKLLPLLKKHKLKSIWVGADIYEFCGKFFQTAGNKFFKIRKILPGDRWQSILPSHFKKHKVILHALGVLHHMEFTTKDLNIFSKDASSTIIYEEPILLKDVPNFWVYALRLAYDVIANVSFQNTWSNDMLTDHKNFSARYLIQEELEKKFILFPVSKRSPYSIFGLKK